MWDEDPNICLVKMVFMSSSLFIFELAKNIFELRNFNRLDELEIIPRKFLTLYPYSILHKLTHSIQSLQKKKKKSISIDLAFKTTKNFKGSIKMSKS